MEGYCYHGDMAGAKAVFDEAIRETVINKYYYNNLHLRQAWGGFLKSRVMGLFCHARALFWKHWASSCLHYFHFEQPFCTHGR